MDLERGMDRPVYNPNNRIHVRNPNEGPRFLNQRLAVWAEEFWVSGLALSVFVGNFHERLSVVVVQQYSTT